MQERVAFLALPIQLFFSLQQYLQAEAGIFLRAYVLHRVGMVKKFTSKKKFGTFAGFLVKLLPAKMVKMVKISS